MFHYIFHYIFHYTFHSTFHYIIHYTFHHIFHHIFHYSPSWRCPPCWGWSRGRTVAGWWGAARPSWASGPCRAPRWGGERSPGSWWWRPSAGGGRPWRLSGPSCRWGAGCSPRRTRRTWGCWWRTLRSLQRRREDSLERDPYKGQQFVTGDR